MQNTNASPVRQTAPEACRGTVRLLRSLGHATLTEFSLTSGRRADIMSLDRKGQITIVEVKSGLADYRTDKKWHEYLEWCNMFYFAVLPSFPREALPVATGIIVADAYGGIVERSAKTAPLAASRRKALTLRFAQSAAMRLSASEDAFGL